MGVVVGDGNEADSGHGDEPASWSDVFGLRGQHDSGSDVRRCRVEQYRIHECSGDGLSPRDGGWSWWGRSGTVQCGGSGWRQWLGSDDVGLIECGARSYYSGHVASASGHGHGRRAGRYGIGSLDVRCCGDERYGCDECGIDGVAERDSGWQAGG